MSKVRTKRTALSVGILALQGAISDHIYHLKRLEIEPVFVKTPEDLSQLDGLILPGGESSTMLNLIQRFALKSSLRSFLENTPSYGVCAGCILQARSVWPRQFSFNVLDISVVRNALGRQIHSKKVFIKDMDESVCFIRAPVIESVGATVTIVAKHDNSPVWVENGKHMATTFHSELTIESHKKCYARFKEIVVQNRRIKQ